MQAELSQAPAGSTIAETNTITSISLKTGHNIVCVGRRDTAFSTGVYIST